MGRYRKARDGSPVIVRGMRVPFTFWPESHLQHGRITTLDPWRCIRVHVHQSVKNTSRRNRAMAFLDQAEDFYLAASAPRIASKPLLHYYSAMNLVKTYLVVHKDLRLDHCMHGLKEPKENIKKRLTITSQSVKANDQASSGRLHIYREFIEECGFSVPTKPKSVKLVDLLEQAVSINGVIARSMNRPPQFFEAHNIAFECNTTAKNAWISFYVDKSDLAVSSSAAKLLRENSMAFEEVESTKPGYRRYESKESPSYTRSPQQALPSLVNATWKDVWSELMPGGFRFWVSTITPKRRLAQLASSYQSMFYFGSLTRYRPDDFHKLADGKHGWMVQEFMNTQPLQFLYFLGSGLIKAEMTMPELTAR